MHVASTRGVQLAVHDLGGDGPVLLVCHATGFHGRAYAPFARHLPGRHVWALDFRGHGASSPPLDDDFDWNGMADDVLAVVEALGGGPVDMLGHSMGGAAILLAEVARPGTVRRAYLYEPIVRTQAWAPPAPGEENRMSGPARRRKEVFGSRAEAMWRYAARPPLAEMRSDALAAYVEYGFVDQADATVRLACRAENEARTFDGAGTMTVEMCPGVAAPVLVAVGETDEGPGPAEYGRPVAEALPNGQLIAYAHLGHFGPFQDPTSVGADVIRFLSGGDS